MLASRKLQTNEETVALGSEDLGGRAEGGAAAVAKKQNFGRGCERVRCVVCGYDGLNFIFTQPILQTHEKRIAGDAVERRKGLIEKKQTGRWRERAGQCHALRLAAGEILRTESGEIGGANKIQHLVYTAFARGAVETVQAVSNVGGGGEVREERGLLRDQRSLAMAGRDAKSSGGFCECAAVEGDAAADRMIEAGE
jgi:hypothetical protein